MDIYGNMDKLSKQKSKGEDTMKLNKIVKVEKKEVDGIGMGAEMLASQDIELECYNEGFNKAKEEYDSKEIEVDREKLIKIIVDMQIKEHDLRLRASDITDTIADNLEKVLRVKENAI